MGFHFLSRLSCALLRSKKVKTVILIVLEVSLFCFILMIDVAKQNSEFRRKAKFGVIKIYIMEIIWGEQNGSGGRDHAWIPQDGRRSQLLRVVLWLSCAFHSKAGTCLYTQT